MLKQRIMTALVLLPIVLGAILFLPRLPFAAVAGLFFVIAGWEWSAMMAQPSKAFRLIWSAILVGLMVAIEVMQPLWLIKFLPLWWLLALVLVIGFPGNASKWYRNPILIVVGYLLLLPSWAAVVQIQQQGAFGLGGAWSLLFILLWVWAADTGAYFAGRALGKHKLAPDVSPAKTIEGLVGGVLLAMAIVLLVAWLAPVQGDRVLMLLVAVVTVLASVLGDLFESMVKRQAGIKDSGTILPGHGGMLDRIDSVTAALPVALMAISWAGLPGGV